MKLKKALTVGNVISQKVSLIDFDVHAPDLYQAFGNPQKRGVWFIWGGSGSGKSSLALAIIKALCAAGNFKGLHNELEEETDDADFIERIKLYQMQDVDFLSASYDYEQLTEYLSRRNSAQAVVINSATYLFKNLDQYFEFTRKFKRNKIIIIIGMAKGNNPYTELEQKIMFDANKKIFCSGYLAQCKGRTIGPNGGSYIIWKEGFERLNGNQTDND